jgi:DNA-binding IclR family transcriptional regulator
MDIGLPKALTEFIWDCIGRLETLETLLLLRSSPDRTWTVEELTQEMRSSEVATAQTIATLVARGLVSRESAGYRFRPKTPVLEARASELAVAYRDKRHTVIRTIFARRDAVARSFAEAFRFRRGPSDD